MKRLLLASLIMMSFIPIVFAESTSKPPVFINAHDIYLPTKRASVVNFDVKAVDNTGRSIAVECDKISGQFFKVGRTQVNCIASDVFGNISRTNFIVTVGYEVVEVPNWFKHTVKFWLDKGITDTEYYNSIEYLLKKKVIVIPSIGNLVDKPSVEIPSWITSSSKLWTEERLGNHEFSIVLKWFIENNHVKFIKHD